MEAATGKELGSFSSTASVPWFISTVDGNPVIVDVEVSENALSYDIQSVFKKRGIPWVFGD